MYRKEYDDIKVVRNEFIMTYARYKLIINIREKGISMGL